MADDLNFSHNVSQLPAGQELPTGSKRTVSVETAGVPDIQGAATQYAQDTNWMSSIGSYVAQQASNKRAQEMGIEQGKDPHGDLGIPLTDFDRVMQKNYNAQAEATLGIQANKLILDSNLEMAKAPRLTPQMIEKTNKSISLGLQNIFKNAPVEVRADLENTYAEKQQMNAYDLTHRMIGEQKEDQKNNTLYSSQVNSDNAYSLGLHGNYEAAQKSVESTKKINDSAVAARLITPAQAKANIDAARKSYLSGKYVSEYEKAKSVGQGESFLKTIANQKPSDIPDSDYMDVTNSLMGYISHQDAMRSQDDQLRISKFYTSVAKDPNGITPAQISDLQANVSPVEFERAQLHYIKAMKAFREDQGQAIEITKSWGDPEGFARLPEKAINQGFDMLVNKYRNQRQQQGMPISQEQAQVEVAAAAGGKVPVFVNGLKNKLNSGNPVQMDQAAAQIDELYSMNASKALDGLTDHDKALFTQYKTLRDAHDPVEAAKMAIQNANQDPDTQRMNKEKWSSYLSQQTQNNKISPTDFALKQVGLSKDNFMNPGIANEYGNLVLNKYSSYFQYTNGDKDLALQLTKKDVDQSFGYTGVNGGKVMTLHPIEKVLGYENNKDVTPFIQQDLMNQMNVHFVPLKEAFNKKEANEYWDVVPKDTTHHENWLGKTVHEPMQVKHYRRFGNEVKVDTYDLVLIGNSFNWDVALKTESGIRPMTQIAPYLHIATYTPDKRAIDKAYREESLKPQMPKQMLASTRLISPTP